MARRLTPIAGSAERTMRDRLSPTARLLLLEFLIDATPGGTWQGGIRDRAIRTGLVFEELRHALVELVRAGEVHVRRGAPDRILLRRWTELTGMPTFAEPDHLDLDLLKAGRDG